MPVARGPQMTARSALVIGISAVVVAVVIGGLVVLASSSGDVEVRLGDTDFNAGRAEAQSAEIADRGPILYQDLGSGSRDLILQHLGEDPERGWLAFDARRPGDPRGCFLEWSGPDRHFVLVATGDTICEEGVIVDEVGTGLEQYPVTVVDDEVRIDLNFEPDDSEDPA